ncbi:MAG: hypothetical protein H0V45_06730 [Actinobacteria bacterium]|nr:hypothetical protein [Actinomycetota bacterium]
MQATRRSIRLTFACTGVVLALLAANHALSDRTGIEHRHAEHGALTTCAVVLALVAAAVLPRLAAPNNRPFTRHRSWTAIVPSPLAYVPVGLASPVRLGRFLN